MAHDRVFTSPISAHRESVTELFRFLDYASVGALAVIQPINVNEAPRAVLELVPARCTSRNPNSRFPTATGPTDSETATSRGVAFADGIVDPSR